MNARAILRRLGRGLETMNQGIRDLDASKLWLPLTVVVAIIVAIGGGAWTASKWATSISYRLDEISGSLENLTDLNGQVHQNTGKLDTLQATIAAQEARIETQAAWINTTRIALAEQGFRTPALPSHTRKGHTP